MPKMIKHPEFWNNFSIDGKKKLNIGREILRMVKYWLLIFTGVMSCISWGQLSVFDTIHNETSYGNYAVKIKEGAQLPDPIVYRYSANGWAYVSAPFSELKKAVKAGFITAINTSYQPVLLNDSALVTHSITPIHSGMEGLPSSYTGKGVIIGYVDTGCDITHGDFLDSDGNSRVLRYWDQTAAVNARTPAKYGYGQIYDSSDFNTGIYPNYAGSGHGTTVAGTGSGNGLANGRNKGVAPESSIIIVKNPVSGGNFTTTVAEAVDYVFAVADTLNMPAVVNLSLGTYLGSHDGTDPATLYIDSLLSDKPGRIVVAAAGNSGAWSPYHIHGETNSDTSFTWLIPNPSFSFGAPGVYVDVWADTNDITNLQFAFGADAPGPVFRGRTDFFQAGAVLNTDIFETLESGGNTIGQLIYNQRIIGPNYNLRALFFTDSLDYRIRFMTTGEGGVFDAWSHVNLGLSNFETIIPDPVIYPDFQHYIFPDTLQSIVSAWACSPQVVTVANMQNRKNYIDFEGNVYPPDGGLVPSGQLSVNSSKGPNRRNILKPDITAAGDLTLSARVMNESYAANQLDEGGLHVRNGGTSMASPVVAGIAALYLEKCPRSTWQDFQNAIRETAFTDEFITSPLPNYAFGAGKANALATLLSTNFAPEVFGDTLLCSKTGLLEVTPDPLSINWSTGETSYPLEVFETNNYSAYVENEKGCKAQSDTLHVVSGTTPNPSLISQLNGALIASNNINYQWYLNDEPLPGETNQTTFPQISGYYSVAATDPSGCMARSNTLFFSVLDLPEVKEQSEITISPNPSSGTLFTSEALNGSYTILSMDGKLVQQGWISGKEISVRELARGLYQLFIVTDQFVKESKFVRN